MFIWSPCCHREDGRKSGESSAPVGRHRSNGQFLRARLSVPGTVTWPAQTNFDSPRPAAPSPHLPVTLCKPLLIAFSIQKNSRKSFPRSAPGCACRAAAPLACMAAVHAGHEATAKQLPAHAGALTGQNPAGFRPFLFQTAAACNRAAIALPGLRRRAKESVRNRPDQFVIARNQSAIAQNQPGGRLSKGRCAPRRLRRTCRRCRFPQGRGNGSSGAEPL